MSMLTVAQAAHRLGVKVPTIYAYVSRGVLESHQADDGRSSLFDSNAIELLAHRGRPRRSSRRTSLDLLIETRLTSIQSHQIRFRGVRVDDLVRTAAFEEVAELLWSGHLPDRFHAWPRNEVPIPDGVTAADAVRIAVSIAASRDPLRSDLRPQAVAATGRHLIATIVDSLPVRGDGRSPRLTLAGRTPLRATIAGRLWTRLSPSRPASPMVAVLNASLVVLADHELAASTLGARVAASTFADPYGVVGAGLGVLSGPLHGQASLHARAVFDRAAEYGPGPAVAAALQTYGMIPGYGQPLYPDGDPRAVVLLDLLRAAAGGGRAMSIVDGVIATSRQRVDQHPNVDLALAALGFVASMPSDSGEVIFAVARSAGWLAHALEEYAEPPLRFRPRASYVGP